MGVAQGHGRLDFVVLGWLTVAEGAHISMQRERWSVVIG